MEDREGMTEDPILSEPSASITTATTEKNSTENTAAATMDQKPPTTEAAPVGLDANAAKVGPDAGAESSKGRAKCSIS